MASPIMPDSSPARSLPKTSTATTPTPPRLKARSCTTDPSPLSAIGARLFSWPQSSRSNHEKQYYNAALGLFLLVADRFGEQAVRDIMTEVTTRHAVDRRDLLKIANRVIGTDIRTLAAEFHFPETGLQLQRLTPALALNHGITTENGLFIVSVEPNRMGINQRPQTLGFRFFHR